jgi:anti-anti-sigma regulatory factor
MAKRNRLHFHEWNGAKVIDLGSAEIWDGADLALLRETLTLLIDRQRHHSVGVNMAHVKYIPSGFFGLLFDWREKGVRVLLFNPQPHVQRMLWFQQFMQQINDRAFLLLSEPKQPYEAGRTPAWATTQPVWELDSEDRPEIDAFASADEDEENPFAMAFAGDEDGDSFED